MTKVYARCILLFYLVGVTFSIPSQQTSQNSNNSLPKKLEAVYDSLKNRNNLEEWLLTAGQYVQESPVERLFLLKLIRDKAWRVCSTDAEKTAWINLLNFEGYYQLYTGKLFSSIDAYENAYNYYQKKPLADVDIVEYCLKPLGNNYTRLGDYEKAFFIQEKALALSLQAKDSQQAAALCNNLAISCRWNGRFIEAINYCERGLMLATKNSEIVGLLRSEMADALLQNNEYDQALNQINQSISIFNKYRNNGDSRIDGWLAASYITTGNILTALNQFPEAQSNYQKAERIYQVKFNNERTREQSKLDLLTGTMLLKWKKPAQALKKFQSALKQQIPTFLPVGDTSLPLSKQLYAENTIADALDGIGNCLTLLDQQHAALGAFKLAFITEISIRKNFYSRSSRQLQQAQSRNRAERAIATAFEMYLRSNEQKWAEQALVLMELSKAQLLWDDIRENIYRSSLKQHDSLVQRAQLLQQAIAYQQREIITAKPGTALLEKAKKEKQELDFELSLLQGQVKKKYPIQMENELDEAQLTASHLLDKIPSNKNVIEYFLGETSMYSIRRENDGHLSMKYYGDANKNNQEISWFALKWFGNNATNMIDSPQLYCEQSLAFFNKFFHGEAKGSIVIIPDGQIAQIPFDALIVENGNETDINSWPYLIRKCETKYVYSLLTLERPTGSRSGLLKGFFISSAIDSFPAIPSVAIEEKILRNKVEGDYFVDNTATLQAFSNSLQGTQLLHVSTHSFLKGDDSIPTICLADSNFYLFELFGRQFQPALVVLSSCRTAGGSLAEGEGLISFGRGFASAGAEGVISAQWNLNDNSSSQLVSLFYDELLQDNVPSSALRKAKLKWLSSNTGNSIFLLPYYWAGLVYYGNDEAVYLESAKTNLITNRWLVGISVVLVLIVLAVIAKKYF